VNIGCPSGRDPKHYIASALGSGAVGPNIRTLTKLLKKFTTCSSSRHLLRQATKLYCAGCLIVFSISGIAKGASLPGAGVMSLKKLGKEHSTVREHSSVRIKRMSQQSRHISLKWKIGGVYTAVMLVLSILVIAAVYQLTQNTLQDQLDKRALAVATNFSDAVAGHLASKNLLAVHSLARKYTLLDGTAYAFVQNGQGEVVAHTFGAFPDELRRGLSPGSRRQVQRRELALMGRAVYETAVPVLEGQMGSVHVGFWADAVETEIRRALFPIVGIVGVVSLIGALVSFLLAHWIVRPILGLTEIADKVTKGDFETMVRGDCIESRDEIGDLARSLERMRCSLKAAMLRLAREVA
jgi:HAMP domain-containing protein